MNHFLYSLEPACVSIILNIILSKVLSNFATEEEKKPPNGAAELSLKEQFMHMMVHHEQVLLMSSLIVGLVVFLSVYLSKVLKPFNMLS